MEKAITYNAHVTVSKPFPEADFPLLWSWIEKSKHHVSCDQSPQSLEDFIAYQIARTQSMQIITWGVYLDGALSGYLEMMPHFLGVPAESDDPCLVPALDKIADGHGIFKREMYGRDKTTTAINLVLQEIFASGIEVMQFSLFSHNRLMIALHGSLGGHFGGSLGEPVTQEGNAVAMEMWVLTKVEWVKANAEWIQEYENHTRQAKAFAAAYELGYPDYETVEKILLGA